MKKERDCALGFNGLLGRFLYVFLLFPAMTFFGEGQEAFAGVAAKERVVVAAAPSAEQKTANAQAKGISKANAAQRYTEEEVSTLYEGKGVGKKTLAQVCKENGLDVAAIKSKLAKQKIQMKEDETLLTAAQRVSKSPIDIVKMILVGEPVRK